MKKFGWLMLMAGILFSGSLQAQVESREEDHFWRKRVVRRIDLGEKINRPLVYHESNFYGGGKYTERQGIVAALINGLKRREYVAYDPDDWNVTYDYEALVARMKEFEQALQAEPEIDWGEGSEDYESGLEEFGFQETASSEWGSFEYAENPSVEMSQGEKPYEPDLAPYEEALHFVEDWVFDKGRSSMQQNLDFFEVIWTDPSGMLPEKVLARFMWKDIQQILERTQWKNRFNDAEVRSMREVFELRIFHSYAINVGGEPIRSLTESAMREQALIEFEHNLWSY